MKTKCDDEYKSYRIGSYYESLRIYMQYQFVDMLLRLSKNKHACLILCYVDDDEHNGTDADWE